MYAFSDGSPTRELATVLIVLGAGLALMRLPLLRRGAEVGVSAVVLWLQRRGLFAPGSVHGELLTLDVLRIPLALLLLGRVSADLSTHFAVGVTPQFGLHVLTALLAFLLLVGLFTPLVAAALALLLNIIIDNYTFNPSLGSMVVAMCLLPMVLGPAGHTLSLDRLLASRGGWAGRAVVAVHRLWGAPTVERIQFARFLALVAYSGICLYSALKHLGSPTWTQGLTTGVILLFPTINPRYYTYFQAFYETFPVLFIWFAKLSTWGMFVWQIFLLPLALSSRWTRLAAIAWGLVFFLFSASVLAIKTLGDYEYVLWALVFANVLRHWLSASAEWLGGWRGPAALLSRSARQIALPHRPGLVGAIAVSFLVLATGYVARLPYVDQLGDGVGARVSRQWLGQAPLAAGMGPIDVFNELDLRVYRNGLTIRLERPDGSGEIVNWAKVWTSESQGSRITVQARMLALQPVTCGTDMTPLILEMLRQTMPAEARLGTRVSLDWLHFTHPDADDFRAFRYVSPAPVVICRVTVPIRDATMAEVTFTEEGRRRLARLGVPLSLPDEQVAVVGRFPCAAEAAVGTFWFDRGTNAPRTADQASALVAMIQARDADPYACYRAFQRLRAALDLDNLPEGLNGRGTCGPDLVAANAYAAALERTASGDRARALVEAATRAQAAGEIATCVTRTGELRMLALGASAPG